MAFFRKPPKEPKEPASAYDRALGLLSRREHSARELKRKLSSRGYDAADGDSAIAALNRADYQSDERFAEVLIRQRAANGYGPRHIEAELRQHGIDSRAFSEQLDAQDWLANATVIVQKKAGRRELDRDARLKLAQHLARRGFPSNIVYAATRVPAEGEVAGEE